MDQADTAVGVVCAHFNLFPASLPLPQRVQDLVASKASPINPPNLTGGSDHLLKNMHTGASVSRDVSARHACILVSLS